jgi:uracil-DNA glycosylase
VPVAFDPGYGEEPFRSLVADRPDESVYPSSSFRVEWGPVFHRGRLDGSARVLVIGQDPAQHEVIARRILIGEAGHRLQGFLWKLGIESSYVLVNTFLYSVYGQQGGERHKADPGVVAYRERWLSAVLASSPIEAVIALGHLADEAWQGFVASHPVDLGYVHITHPTQPESASRHDPSQHAPLITALLEDWNRGLDTIAPFVTHPDVERPLTPYGAAFAPGDKVPIPMADLPAGSPPWMAEDDGWAERPDEGPLKRWTITVTVPGHAEP